MAFLGGLFGGGKSSYQQDPFQSTAGNNLRAESEILAGKGYGGQLLNDKLKAYQAGDINLQQALNEQWSTPVSREQVFLDPSTGSLAATEQIQDSKILGQIYGEGGSMSRAALEEQELANRGYSLQPEDYEAYGQASGDLARLFGQQEQGLAQSLANRGLAGAGTGAAVKGFAGLQGNKYEQLAGAQRKIADDRMQRNMERLGQTRSYLTNLTGLGQDAINQQFNRNLEGVNTRRQTMANQYNRDSMEHQQREAEKQFRAGADDAASQSGLLGAVSGGIMSGVTGGIQSGVGGQVKGLFGGGGSKSVL